MLNLDVCLIGECNMTKQIEEHVYNKVSNVDHQISHHIYFSVACKVASVAMGLLMVGTGNTKTCEMNYFHFVTKTKSSMALYPWSTHSPYQLFIQYAWWIDHVGVGCWVYGVFLKFDVDVGLLNQPHEEPAIKKILPLPPSLEKVPHGSCFQTQKDPYKGAM